MPRLSKTSSPLTALLLPGLTFLFLQCLPLTTASSLPVLHIGGFFSIFNEQGVVDVAQLEHASVFLQAVDEINNNPSILPNYELQVVMGNGANSLEAAFSTKQMFQINSFVGAVNALDNIKGEFLTQIFEESNSMIVNSMTRDSSFGEEGRFPFMVQTIPLISHQGKAYQYIECRLNLTRLAIFTTDDINGRRFADQFSDGTYCRINLLGKYSFPSHTTDFTEILLDAMKMEGRSFLMYIESAATVRRILEQGYNIGLFREGTQILLGEVQGFDEAFYDLPVKEVEAITKGVIGLEYTPEYSVYTTTRGLKFYNSWINQTTLGNCSTTVDAAGNKYLLHSSGSCASLNFTSYELKDSSLNSYAVLSYDAAYTLAWGLHYAIQDGLLLTGQNLSQTIIRKVNFVGASGLVDISAGDSRLYGRGDRNLGAYYKFLNFHIDAYQTTGSGFRPFFMLAEGASRPCPSSLYKCRGPVLTKTTGWASGYPPYAFATAPEIVKIGGLFSAFVDGESTLDKENAEFLAMFLMAVSEINNKTDGINDNLLPSTQLKVSVVNSVSTALSGATAYADLKDSFYHRGVSGIINTLSSELVKSINSYALQDKTFQVLSRAEDADLAEGLEYAYKSSTVPLDSFIGTVFQDFLCSHDLEKIAIFAEDSSFGLRATIDLTTPNDNGCQLKVLYQSSFPSSTTDFTSMISEVKKSGAQIIVVFAGPSTTATLLMQGTDQGVFLGDMLYLTSELDKVTEELESTHNLNTKQVIHVMRGVVSASFFPEYGVKHTEMGESFVNRFLKFGESRVSSYVKKCKQFDDSAKRYMLRNTATGEGCAELNYTKYITGELELGPYAAMAYDATYALAWAVHDVLLNSKPLTSDNIRDSMYDSVNFEGVSGEIDILRGTSIRTGYNQGNRVNGVHYRLMNFNEFVYSGVDSSSSSSVANPNPNAINSNNSGFVMVGLWNLEHGVEECHDGLTCYKMIYANTPSTQIPGDSRPPIIYDFTESFRLFLYILGGVTIFVSFVFLMLTIRFRDLADIQNSQEYLLYCVLLGGLLAGGRVINSALPLSDKSCLAGFWLSNLSFWFAMMAFFLKSWRVNRLLAIRSIKRVRITTSQVMCYMFLSVVFLVGMMVLLTIVGEPHYDEVVSVSSNRETIVPFCDMVRPEVQTTLYVMHALLLGTGLKICWSLRDVPKKFSDFHTIGSATIVIAAFSVFVMPIVYLLGLRHDMSSAAATVAFGAGGIIVMVIVFGEKFLPLFKCTKSASKILDDSQTPAQSALVQIFSQDVVRQMKPDEQFEYYTKIIQKYTALRLQLNSGESTNSQSETKSKYDEENPSKNGRPNSTNDSKILSDIQQPTI